MAPSNPHAKSTGLAALALALAITWTPTPLRAGTEAPPVVTPIIQIDGPRVVACGLQAAFEGADVSLINRRVGDTTQIELAVTPRATASQASALSSATLATTSHDTGRLLEPSTQTPSGAAFAKGSVDPTTGAYLFQEMTLSGAKVTLTRATGAVELLTIPGPLPREARNGFLNCSGDLFPRTR